MIAKVLKIGGIVTSVVGFMLLFYWYDQAALAGLIIMLVGAAAAFSGFKTSQVVAYRQK
jgi:UPF0716 family protein affecting phage T7 exclusion